MPDLKSELNKVLNEWNTPEAQPATKAYFSVTNNVTRITFDYVRDNPGKTRKEIAIALEKQGYKTGSVTSLLGQMVKQGMVRESTGLLYVTTGEYTPLKSSKKMKALEEKPQAPQRKIVNITRRAAPEAVHTRQIDNLLNPVTLLNTMSIRQARELYDELRKIFGG
jgi:hypothetical protein